MPARARAISSRPALASRRQLYRRPLRLQLQNWLYQHTQDGTRLGADRPAGHLALFRCSAPLCARRGNSRGTNRHRDCGWGPLALACLSAVGVVRDRGRLPRHAGALPRALESSREIGQKPSTQCVHILPDPSRGAGRVCLCAACGGALPAAQIGHHGARHAPALLPDQRP